MQRNEERILGIASALVLLFSLIATLVGQVYLTGRNSVARVP
jgi:hypothetical protein